MSEISPERVAATEQLAKDAWELILNRTRNMDDVVLCLEMLLVQAIAGTGDPQGVIEPLLRQINQFVRDTVEENYGKPRSH
jgi:hypothetical protein